MRFIAVSEMEVGGRQYVICYMLEGNIVISKMNIYKPADTERKRLKKE